MCHLTNLPFKENYFKQLTPCYREMVDQHFYPCYPAIQVSPCPLNLLKHALMHLHYIIPLSPSPAINIWFIAA